MRRFLLILVIGLIPCAAKASIFENRDVTNLKRDLSKAQRELEVARTRVQKLEEAIAQQEIKRIGKEIEKIETNDATTLLHSQEQRLAFFSDQRQTLSDIIQNYPGCALQAQAVLDQILTFITHISDEIID